MANRYTEITPSQFNPLSLQELMLVPATKRKEHDEILAKQESLRQGLAKVDPLDVHYDEALKLKQDLESQLDKTASQLAREGINSNMTGETIALNRRYNDLIAPTGRLGKINIAKQIYNKEFENYLEDATKNKGFSREDALYNWQKEHSPKYTGYNQNQDIVNIGSYGAPKRLILQDDLKTVKSLLGEETKTLMKNNDFGFTTGPNGSLVVRDGKGRLVETTNIPQLNEALKYLNSRWVQPTGEGTMSAKFERQDPSRIASEINSGLGIMRTVKQDDTRETDYSVQGYKNPLDIEPVDPTGIIISNDTKLTTDALNESNYTAAHSKIKQLESSPSLNPADKAKLDDLKELRSNADLKMKRDPQFIKAKKEYDEALRHLKANNYPTMGRGAEGEVAIRKAAVDRTAAKVTQIKDNYWKQSSSLRHNYSYMPSNPKEESVWNLHNENVHNSLKGISDLGNALDLTSIYTTNGSKKNINQDDVKNIQDLIKSADSKSFKINNIKTYGDNKTPEITVTFNTQKGTSEYNMDRGLFSAGRTDKYGGEEKPVTITFKLKKFSNAPDTGSAPGFKNLTGAIAGFWKDKGGVNEITGNHQGNEVYNSLIQNAYSGISNEELYSRAQTDSDAREALLIRVAKHQQNKNK